MDDFESKQLNESDREETESQPAQSPLGTNLPDELPEARLADLPEKLREGAARAGWSELMPVQAKAIPYLFSGRDMLIQSRTGS